MSKKYLIYKCTSTKSLHSYIGQTCFDLNKRIRNHYTTSRKSGTDYPFMRALRKYEKEELVWEVLFENLSFEEANNKEKELIEFYNTLAPNGWNTCTGGQGTEGHKKSEAEVLAMRERALKQFGTEEAKRRVSERFKGQVPHNKGVPCSDAKKENIRQAKLAQNLTQVAWNLGVTTPDEVKLRIAKTANGGRSFICFDPSGTLVGEFYSQSECARKIGLRQGHISNCLSGKNKTYQGYTFRYIDKKAS